MVDRLMSLSLLICLLANLYCTWKAYHKSRRIEKENEQLKEDIQRKDRMLKAWEEDAVDRSYLKRLQTMSEAEKKVYLLGNWTYTSHPCERCGTGWGTADAKGVHTCEETCERLAAWNEKQQKED